MPELRSLYLLGLGEHTMRSICSLSCGACALAVLALLSACAASVDPSLRDPAPEKRFATEASYRIGADDKVQVTVWRNPELSVMVPVRPDGMISVPLIGDVMAGGKTPTEVAETIRRKLTAYIREPVVTVILTELKSHEYLSRVRITGAIRTPKSIPYRQGMTVLDAVLESGGINEFASSNRSKLYRKSGGATVVFDVELGDILEKGKLETNYSLLPGDVITIPERLF